MSAKKVLFILASFVVLIFTTTQIAIADDTKYDPSVHVYREGLEGEGIGQFVPGGQALMDESGHEFYGKYVHFG